MITRMWFDRALPILALAMVGCAGGARTAVETPADIARLQQAYERGTASGDTLARLGAAYYRADRPRDAINVLQQALGAQDAPAAAHVHMGLSYERLGEWGAARDAYASYLSSDPPAGDLSEDVERRILLAQHEASREEARRLVEYESMLSRQAPEPRTVAVFPFRVVGDDPRYAPLEVALADMITTDLAVPGVLTLLERARIQAVLQEMALTLGGYTAPESGARVGRLMRAQNIVQGSVVLLPDERVRIEAAVVDAEEARPEGSVGGEDALDRIFDAEKALVLDILDVLGVTLTAAELERIQENRTDNLLAFLAYGEGLRAMDRGDFVRARSDFERAADMDPGFRAAQIRAAEAERIGRARQTEPARVAQNASESIPSGRAAADDLALADRTVGATVSSPADRMLDIGRLGTQDARGLSDERDTGYEDREGEVAAGGTVIRITIPNPTLP